MHWPEQSRIMRITNKMIYDEIVELKNHVKETNGRVKLNKWIATTALTIVISVIFYIIAI